MIIYTCRGTHFSPYNRIVQRAPSSSTLPSYPSQWEKRKYLLNVMQIVRGEFIIESQKYARNIGSLISFTNLVEFRRVGRRSSAGENSRNTGPGVINRQITRARRLSGTDVRRTLVDAWFDFVSLALLYTDRLLHNASCNSLTLFTCASHTA